MRIKLLLEFINEVILNSLRLIEKNSFKTTDDIEGSIVGKVHELLDNKKYKESLHNIFYDGGLETSAYSNLMKVLLPFSIKINNLYNNKSLEFDNLNVRLLVNLVFNILYSIIDVINESSKSLEDERNSLNKVKQKIEEILSNESKYNKFLYSYFVNGTYWGPLHFNYMETIYNIIDFLYKIKIKYYDH